MVLIEEDLIEVERFKADVDILLRLAYKVNKDPNVVSVNTFENHLALVVASAVALQEDIKIVC